MAVRNQDLKRNRMFNKKDCVHLHKDKQTNLQLTKTPHGESCNTGKSVSESYGMNPSWSLVNLNQIAHGKSEYYGNASRDDFCLRKSVSKQIDRFSEVFDVKDRNSQ